MLYFIKTLLVKARKGNSHESGIERDLALNLEKEIPELLKEIGLWETPRHE